MKTMMLLITAALLCGCLEKKPDAKMMLSEVETTAFEEWQTSRSLDKDPTESNKAAQMVAATAHHEAVRDARRAGIGQDHIEAAIYRGMDKGLAEERKLREILEGK